MLAGVPSNDLGHQGQATKRGVQPVGIVAAAPVVDHQRRFKQGINRPSLSSSSRTRPALKVATQALSGRSRIAERQLGAVYCGPATTIAAIDSGPPNGRVATRSPARRSKQATPCRL